MAGAEGYQEEARKYIARLCRPNGCVYAGVDCNQKYTEEVIIDFTTGDKTCCVAAREDTVDHVIPGQMTMNGFEPYTSQAITIRTHKSSIVASAGGKVTFVA